MNEKICLSELSFVPLGSEVWSDFETLFGKRGACGGCWCMTWRLKKSVFDSQKGEGNKNSMKAIVESGEIPGIMAFYRGEAAAWCAVAPRESYTKLNNSKVLARVDESEVWSITCFFIAKPFRRKGFSVELLKGVIEYCRSNNVKIIEAYPVIPYNNSIPDAFAWTGILSSFEKAGFTEAARRSPNRPIMRFYL